jgi:hypothetical protein
MKRWKPIGVGLVILGAVSSAGAQEIPDAAAVTAAVNASCGSGPLTLDMPPAARMEALACFTRAAAAELNRSLPVKNGIIIVERATASGGELGYHYRVDADRSQFAEGAWESTKQTVAQSTCAEEASKKVILFGGSYRHIWVDRAGLTLAELVVDRC